MWGHFKNGVLKACDAVCGKKRGRRSKGDTCWWNEVVKEAVSKMKDAHKVMCLNNTEENKRRYKSMTNKSRKAVRDEAEDALTELKNFQNIMFSLGERLKTDSEKLKDIDVCELVIESCVLVRRERQSLKVLYGKDHE